MYDNLFCLGNRIVITEIVTQFSHGDVSKCLAMVKPTGCCNSIEFWVLLIEDNVYFIVIFQTDQFGYLEITKKFEIIMESKNMVYNLFFSVGGVVALLMIALNAPKSIQNSKWQCISLKGRGRYYYVQVLLRISKSYFSLAFAR